MKRTQFARLLLLALTLTAAFGCHKRPSNVTDLPGYKPEPIGDPFANTGIDTNSLAGSGTNTPLPMSNPDIRKDWPRDRQVFKAYTVHFDYDSTAVKPGENLCWRNIRNEGLSAQIHRFWRFTNSRLGLSFNKL